MWTSKTLLTSLMALIPLAFLAVGCGNDSKTLSLTYALGTAGSLAPDLVITISADSALTNFDQNLAAVVGPDGQPVTFYDSQANLRKCVLDQGHIGSSDSVFAEGLTGENSCAALGEFYRQSIFVGGALEAEGGLPVAPELGLGGDGYVFALFFFNASNAAAAVRCFQIYAARVEGKRLVRSDGTLLGGDSVTLTTMTTGEAVPPANCFSYK